MATQRFYIKSEDFIPSEELILIKQQEIKKEETSTSGIVISLKKESITNRPGSGEVISIGHAVKNIQEKDFVFFPNTDGIDIEFDDGEFMLIREKSVIGKRK